MKINDSVNLALLSCLVLVLTDPSVHSQQTYHEPGGALVHFSDVYFDSNGDVVALGISEEDFDDWGHWVSVTTTISGGASNRTATDIETGRFFVCAEARLVLGDNDAGWYDVESEHNWNCPYVSNGLNEFTGLPRFYIGVSLVNMKKAVEIVIPPLYQCTYYKDCGTYIPICDAYVQNPAVGVQNTPCKLYQLHQIPFIQFLEGPTICSPIGRYVASNVRSTCL